MQINNVVGIGRNLWVKMKVVHCLATYRCRIPEVDRYDKDYEGGDVTAWVSLFLHDEQAQERPADCFADGTQLEEKNCVRNSI